MRLIPHDPDHGNTWSLPYDFNPGATCEGIQDFLLDRLEDPASVAVFRAFAKSLLLGDRLKCFLEITGPSNTGKSNVTNLLVALVGNQNTAAGKLHRLENATQRFETLKFRGKRLALFSECQDYSGQLQTVKALTGGDPIAAEIKGGRHVDFTFSGGVVLSGNGPIRPSDPSGAVINRRRSLHVGKVIQASDERSMLESDGEGGWEGDLAPELPGLVNWALTMPPGEARSALARDVQSMARVEADLQALLATDYLAEWADQCLEWQPAGQLQIGTSENDADRFLYASYLRFMQQQGPSARSLSLRVFKPKLIDLLRDTLNLPLPAGSISKGDYRVRGSGSVIPCIGWRSREGGGVVRHGALRRISGTDQQSPGTDRERQNPNRERMERMERVRDSQP